MIASAKPMSFMAFSWEQGIVSQKRAGEKSPIG